MRAYKRCLTVLIIGLACLYPVLGRAQSDMEYPNHEDTSVEIRESKKSGAGKILLLPFMLPVFAVKLVTFPLIAGGRAMERGKVGNIVRNALSNEEGTFYIYPYLELGLGSGFGGGFGVVHTNLFNEGYKAGGRATVFVDLDLRAYSYFGHDEAFSIMGRPVGFRVGSYFALESTEAFFGVGNNSQEANKSNFSYNEVDVGLEGDYEFIRNLHFKPRLVFLTIDTGSARRTSTPSIETVFNRNTLVGFGERLDHISIGATLAHDTRENAPVPHHGGLRRFTFQRFQDVSGNDTSFNQYDIEFIQYFQLWAPRVSLALRNAWQFQQVFGSNQIPFNMLSQLDSTHMLRGFTRGRFRDTSSVIFNIQFSYPIWDYVDALVFYDTGRVFNGPSDFSFNAWKYSIGGGIRIITERFFLARFTAASGGEGIKVALNIKRFF